MGSAPSRTRGHGRKARYWVRAPRMNVPILIAGLDQDERLTAHLREAGVRPQWCSDGADALVMFGRMNPSVVLLVPSLPDVPCAEVVSAMRRFGAPLILIGVGDGEADLVGPAFMAGAAGAVRRPFDAAEILECITSGLPTLAPGTGLEFGPLMLDELSHSVRMDHAELPPLPPKEFSLLVVLMRHADHVVTPEQIRAHLWPGETPPSDKSIAVHVRRLRLRLPPPMTIRTVRGLGYRLTVS